MYLLKLRDFSSVYHQLPAATIETRSYRESWIIRKSSAQQFGLS